jgi:hypothetical protein
MPCAQVSNALVSGPEVVRSTALHAVSNNPGLQPLLPYLVQFISDEVVEQIKSSARLAVALRLVSALIASPHLHLEPFAHQVPLLHPVGCHASNKPAPDYASRHHVHRVQGAWCAEERRAALRSSARPLVRVLQPCIRRHAPALTARRLRRYIRENAVVLVVRILNRYGAAYPTLIPRTMRTLLHALLDPSKVMPCPASVCCASVSMCLPPLLFACLLASDHHCTSVSVSAAFLHPLWCAERHIRHVPALDRHAAAAAHAAVRPQLQPCAQTI